MSAAPTHRAHRVHRPLSLGRRPRTVPALVVALVVVAGACSGGSSGGSVTASSGHDHGDHSHSAGDDALPLGDGKVSAGPETGSVYSCQQRFDPNGPGASDGNSWIDGEWWDPSEKATVDGEVDWPDAEVTVTVRGAQRVVAANNLPNH
ncbi:MAG: hypothetical protein ACRCZP_04970, partial [Phycicoccus sp.]